MRDATASACMRVTRGLPVTWWAQSPSPDSRAVPKDFINAFDDARFNELCAPARICMLFRVDTMVDTAPPAGYAPTLHVYC